MAEHTQPSQATRDEERGESGKEHEAGRGPTGEESTAAEGNRLDPSVSQHEREMAERGAHQQGEGRLS